MNEELTREVLEALKRCNDTICSDCAANDYCSKYNCRFCSKVFKPDEYHIEYSKTISGRLIEYRFCPACKSPMIALVEK